MGQRVKLKKNRSSAKGVAIKRTSNKTGYNTITVGNTTIKNNSNGKNKNSNSNKKKKSNKKRRR